MADPASSVSVGALRAIFDESKPEVPPPILQCCQIKAFPPQPGSPERYRAIFSDISNFVQTMIATQLNHFVTSGKLRRGCFACLKSYQASVVKGKRILIILDLDVLEELGEREKLGDPQQLEPKQTEQGSVPTAMPSNGFYGSKGPQNPPLQSRPEPQRQVAPSSAHANIYPIEALSPYSNKWTIKARCTNKSVIKKWHNMNGEGKLFSVNLLDESGEIRATAFKEQCDAFYDVFEEGGVYFISSPCRVQMAKRQFNNLNNDYELMFERNTVVEKAEDQDDVPQVRYNFISIGELQTVEKDTTIDVLGVLKDVAEVNQIVSQATKKPYDKRELTLVDNSGFSVRLTVWGNVATSFDVVPGSVVAFKGVKVSDFNGRSLSLLSSGSMTVDPDIEDSHRLKGWYDAQGRSDTFTSHASMSNTVSTAGGRPDSFKTIAEVQDEQLGMSEKPDFFSLRATITALKQETMCYPACLTDGCNKKVIQVDTDQWRCEKCDKTHPKPEYRYILSVGVCDHSGQIWLNCFDEVGKSMLGTSADQLMEMKEYNEKAYLDVVQDAKYQTWNFRCKARMDNFQMQPRVRYQVSSATPIDFSAESSRLTELIKQYNLS